MTPISKLRICPADSFASVFVEMPFLSPGLAGLAAPQGGSVSSRPASAASLPGLARGPGLDLREEHEGLIDPPEGRLGCGLAAAKRRPPIQ